MLYRKNWFDANLYCKNSLSSTLVSVYSAEENAFVMKLSNDSMWIGLDSKGVYRGNVQVLYKKCVLHVSV